MDAISSFETPAERGRRTAGIVLAPVAFTLLYIGTAGDLDPRGQALAAILGSVVALWVTEALPLPVTSLLGAILCVVLGVAPARQVFAHFADPIVFLFIGSFMLARAMAVHRLDRRIALSVLSVRWVSARPARLLAAIGLVTAVMSMWVSNTATTAMMLPIVLGILNAVHYTRAAAGGVGSPPAAHPWPFATGMMLMIAYAASIGGIGTPIGSPPNLIGIALIRNSAAVNISFFTWMALAVPMLVAMAIALFLLLHRLHRDTPPAQRAADTANLSGAEMRMHVERERALLGGWTVGQVNTLVACGIAVTLWTLPGVLSVVGQQESALGVWMQTRTPEAVVAMTAAILLFILPLDRRMSRFTLTWTDAVQIDWGTILLFGGGLALGTLMFDTGVAGALGERLAAYLGASSVWTLTFAAIAFGIVLSETTSNTAAANMVIPVVIAIAQAAGLNPVPPALGACFGASFGFMLPVSTPPNAIAYASGLVPIAKMMRAGLLFDVIGLFIIWAGLRVICPVLGLV